MEAATTATLRRLGREIVGPAVCLHLEYAIDVVHANELEHVCVLGRARLLADLARGMVAEDRRAAPTVHVAEVQTRTFAAATLRRLGPRQLGVPGRARPPSLEAVLAHHDLLDDEMRVVVARSRLGRLQLPLVAPWNDSALHELLDAPEFQRLVTARSDRARAELRSGFGDQGALSTGQPFCLVDTGFESRTQDLLGELADELGSGTVFGVYLALLPRHLREEPHPERKVGVVFDHRRGRGLAQRAVVQLRTLFERSCGEPVGALADLQVGIREAAARHVVSRDRARFALARTEVHRTIERLAFYPSREEIKAIHEVQDSAPRDSVSKGPPPAGLHRLRELVRRANVDWKAGLLGRVGGRPLLAAYHLYQHLRLRTAAS